MNTLRIKIDQFKHNKILMRKFDMKNINEYLVLACWGSVLPLPDTCKPGFRIMTGNMAVPHNNQLTQKFKQGWQDA